MDTNETPRRLESAGGEDWMDDILETPIHGEELLPDEDAIAAAGLTHPTDIEVEQIIQETLSQFSEEPDPAPVQLPTEPPFKDAEYRDAFGDGEDLSAVFASESEEKSSSHKKQTPRPKTDSGKTISSKSDDTLPIRKKRPLRRGKDNLFGLSHLLASCIWLAIIVFIGVSLANVLWVCASDVLAFGREDHSVSISIEESDTMADIAEKLCNAGLIRYPNLFSLYAQLTGAREDISAGTFTLNTMYDYHALVNFMNYNSSERETVEVVIPEGYTCAQIFALLENKGVCTTAELEEWASSGALDDYWFLEGIARGDRYCLEGFLFPDTYEFYLQDDPRRVLEKMLDDFDYRFNDELRSSLIALNERLSGWMEDVGYDQAEIDAHQLTTKELVTVASMIEKETANTLESYTISSVIYNRLYRWGDTPSYLNIDAAILYALGEHKEELTQADLQIDSPYNTYTHIGLTPGPICNPGLHSLNAALDPDDTDYYYYAMDPDVGSHHFSTSEDAHNAFLESLEDD